MKKVLVTGGSRGIGSQISKLLKEKGYMVETPERSELDLTNLQSIEGYFSHNTNFDILINNAGINVLAQIESIEHDSWHEMVAVNLTAPMLLIQKVVPYMKEAKWGRIVNISSMFSNITKEKRGAYSAVKSGLNGLTRTAAVELAPFGVLVNSVCPGYVETDLTYQNNSPSEIEKILQDIPIGRMAKAVEIAELVEFLISDRNSYLTGQSITIDGGFTLK